MAKGRDECRKLVQPSSGPDYGATSNTAAAGSGQKGFFARHDVKIQLLFLLLAQGLRQFFYADALPGEMEDHDLISQHTAGNLAWVFAFVIPDVLLRCVLVLLSRAPSIIHDSKVLPGADHQKTCDLVGDYIPSFDLNYQQLLANNKKFYNFSMALGYVDAFFAIPSTMFFAEGCYGAFRKGDKAKWEQGLVAAVGFIIGVYGARSYISFRIPRSVGRMSLVLREIKRNWADSNVNGRKLAGAIAWSIYVAAVQGVFTFFSGYKMMERSVKLINQQDSEAWQVTAKAIAVLCAFVCFHTNFYNSMTTELRKCVNRTSPPSSGDSSLSSSLTEGGPADSETQDAADLEVGSILTMGDAPNSSVRSSPPFERQPTDLDLVSADHRATVSESSKKTVRGIGLVSIAVDAVLTEMTCFFLVKFFHVDPDASPAAFWGTFAGLALFLFPNNVYTVRYTLGKAVDGLASVFGLFCCGSRVEPDSAHLQGGLQRPASAPLF